MDSFTYTYAETGLFASMDDDGEPLDRRYRVSELAPSAQRAMQSDCDAFRTLLSDAGLSRYLSDYEQVAHDFWLTRNHHGAGFWDGDYPEPAASKLTELAHGFGEADLYVGQDGLIYQYGSEGD